MTQENKPQKLTPFSLKTWQENPNLKVVTRSGEQIKGLYIEGIFLRAEVKSIGVKWTWYEDGRDSMFATSEYDLFFADPEPEEEMYVNYYGIGGNLYVRVMSSKQDAIESALPGAVLYKLTKVTE